MAGEDEAPELPTLDEGSGAEFLSEGGAPSSLATSVSILILGEPPHAAGLSDALAAAFRKAGLEMKTGAEDSDTVLIFPGADVSHVPAAPDVIVIGATDRLVAEDQAGLSTAEALQAAYLPTVCLISRSGRLNGSGAANDSGPHLLAKAICDGVLAKKGYAAPVCAAPPRLHAKTANPVNWAGSSAPASLAIEFAAEELEHFIEGKIRVLHPEGERAIAFQFPFSWDMPLHARGTTHLYGLDALTNVLAYWLMRANRAPIPHGAHIEVLLRERGITASGLLVAAGAVMLDFLNAGDRLPQAAWTLDAVRRRAIALELFLLCCKTAAERRIRFNEAACAPAFEHLSYLLESLAAASTLRLGSAAALADTVMLIGLILPVRETPSGAGLLRPALEILEHGHINRGMSAEGVWKEGFPQHCAILSSLRKLIGDLRIAGVPAPFVSSAIAKLAGFFDLFVGSEGRSLPIAELPPLDLKRAAAVNRAVVRKAAGGAIPPNQGYFPQSGYFISRAPKPEYKLPSHLVVLARPANKGGMSLSFSVGGLALLIGGGTNDQKAPKEVRNAALEDPAAHNAVRINGLVHANASPAADAIRLAGTWKGKEFAAARILNEAFAPVVVSRTVIHLLSAASLLVVDEILSPAKAAEVQQFWHFAPELNAHRDPLFFSAPKRGILSVAFEGGQVTGPVTDGEEPIGWTAKAKRKVVRNPYLVCSTKTSKGIMAAFFGWGSKFSRTELHVQRLERGWRIALGGDGPGAAFAFEDGRLTATA